MNKTSDANRNLLKYGLILALLGYTLYEFVMEYFSGNETGFTPVVFAIGLVILGGGTLFSGVLALRAWKVSQKEAAEALDAMEKEKTEE